MGIKLGKIIGFNIVALITMINTFYVYFGGDFEAFTFTKSFFKTIALGIISILVIWLLTLFVNLSFIVKRVIVKKNLLKISAIVFILFFAVGLILRINSALEGIYSLAAWFNTILYLILTIIIYFFLKELHNLIERLFNK